MIIELATSLVFLASSIYGPATTTTATIDVQNEPVAPITLEDHVKDYFKSNPILAEISKCESNFRQFTKSGQVIRGIENRADVGLMQINETYHADRAKKLGYDIYSVEGNLAYGAFLYQEQGTKPWKASEKCWGKSEVALK